MKPGADEAPHPPRALGPDAATPDPPTPDVRLSLAARPENVALARQALAGMLEVVPVEEAVAADMKIAVTEACTNVVLHAYDGSAGPMEVGMAAREGRLTVTVRDQGRGVAPLPAETAAPAMGYGLALIASLTEEFALRGGASGTTVEMAFALPAQALRAKAPEARPPVELAAGADLEAIMVSVVQGPYVAPVLGRVVSMLAARADFSIDRLSDAQLVSDAVATNSQAHTLDGHVRVLVSEAPDTIALEVGPLVAGGARALVRATELPSLGSILERLADDVTVLPAPDAPGGDAERLRVALSSRR